MTTEPAPAAATDEAPSAQPPARVSTVRALLQGMRPRQWTKNLLLFAGMLFTLNETWTPFSPEMWINLERSSIAFALFCLISSSVYLSNDIVDIEKDRQHPKKKLRPLAAGTLSPKLALATSLLLMTIAIGGAFMLSQSYGMLLLAYLAMQAGYTFFWKHVVLVDVFVIAIGFVMRAVGGVLALGAAISPWFYLVTLLGALFLGLAKRKNELSTVDGSGQASSHRKILDEYSHALLDKLISIVASATLMAYSLYTFTAPKLPSNHSMMLTIPLVLYGLFRYLYLLHMKEQGGSPEEVLLRDRPIQVVILLFVGITVAVLTVGRSM